MLKTCNVAVYLQPAKFQGHFEVYLLLKGIIFGHHIFTDQDL